MIEDQPLSTERADRAVNPQCNRTHIQPALNLRHRGVGQIDDLCVVGSDRRIDRINPDILRAGEMPDADDRDQCCENKCLSHDSSFDVEWLTALSRTIRRVAKTTAGSLPEASQHASTIFAVCGGPSFSRVIGTLRT